ncbi:MAG TPA: 2-hydroxychromene-2-carboxylate isomerase [Caldimonas sp.]|nr:2-hydroxychromene-2-carboxylate isomerase [Caldimonas sp.]
MKTVDVWLDFISPFAYLAFERLPEAFAGLSYDTRYRPILFGALLKHWSHKGPAEIEPKRAWTFRHVHWLAHRHGIEMQTPAQHPFNPLALLRLAYACAGPGGVPNRHVCATIFRHVWQGGGADANDPDRLAELVARLAPARDPQGNEAKTALKDETARAIEGGVFGVPTFGVDGRLFWGFDALDMVAGAMRADPWFASGGAWDREGESRPGVVRAR